MVNVVARWRAGYTAGDWLVLAGPTALVVVDPRAAELPEVEALWSEVVGAASMTELVATVARLDRRRAADLLVVFWDEDGLRTLARGDVAVVDTESGDVVADRPGGVVTWRESSLGAVQDVTVRLGRSTEPLPGPVLPLVVGAVRAGELRLDARGGATVTSPQGPAGVFGVLDDEAPSSSTEPGASAEGSPESAAEDPESAAETQREPGAETEADLGAGPEPEPTAMLPGVAAAGVAAGVAAPGFVGGPAAPGTPIELDTATARTDAGPDDQPSAGPGDDDLETGATQLMPLPFGPDATTLAPAQPTATGPMVPAALCTRGHPNPPYAEGCWVCGADVPPQEPRPVPRPVLGRLRAPDGTAMDLDRPVVIGRAPSTAGVEGERPRLLTVPSPSHDISRTHVLVAPEGWQILVTDLGSTNGTTAVTPGPGVDRIALQSGQALSVAVGTLLELGDGVAVLIDAAQ